MTQRRPATTRTRGRRITAGRARPVRVSGVYGLDPRCAFPIAGVPLPGAGGAGHPRRTLVDRLRGALPAAAPAATAATAIVTRRAPDGRLIASLDHEPTVGYRMFADGWGRFVIAGDGARVGCAASDSLAPWLFERFLAGQVLPFAALLHGLEPFHASGVALDDRVIGLAGTCGAGKTSVALNLVLRGAGFFSDDVLTLEATAGGDLTCHPGPAAANVRDGRLRASAEAGEPPFRGVVGAAPASLRALVEHEERPLKLGALYFLDHGRGEVAFERLHNPFVLIGHTFNVAIRTPAWLARQLDVCARIASHSMMFRAHVPRWMDAEQLARVIDEHARRHIAAAVLA